MDLLPYADYENNPHSGRLHGDPALRTGKFDTMMLWRRRLSRTLRPKKQCIFLRFWCSLAEPRLRACGNYHKAFHTLPQEQFTNEVS